MAQNNHLHIFIRMLKIGYMWPAWRSGKLFLYWHHLVVFLGSLNFAYILLCLYTTLVFQSQDLSESTNVEFATAISSGAFRFIYFFFRGASLERLTTDMGDIFVQQSFNTEGPRYDTQPMTVRAKRLSLLYFVTSILFIIQMSFGPLLTYIFTSSPLPPVFEVWQPVDGTEWYNRVWIYIQQSSACLHTGLHYLMLDSLWFYIIFLTIDQFELIAYSYEKLTKTLEDSPVTSESHGESKDTPEDIFMQCYLHHRNIRRFKRDVEDVFSPILLVDFMQSVPSITFISLDLTIALKNKDWPKTLYLAEYLVVALSHMFYYHYLANELNLTEMKVRRSIYATSWYNAPKACKTPLLMSMAISDQPYRLSGGKLFRLSLEFFNQAMKTVFSFITVLFQVSGGSEVG